MIVTSFDRDDDLIVIEATIWGARSGRRAVRMALDTGSSETLIIPEVTDALGYGPHLGDRITVIRSVVGREQGYMMRVARFGALGFELPDFRMHVHDLPEDYGIEGLLGLSFLRHFDNDICSLRGEVHVRHASRG